MSRGPGRRIQRAILDLIATDEATAPFDHENHEYHGGPGPVGVPLTAVFVAVYGACGYVPTRAQRVAVRRAVRALCSHGLIDTYSRRVCHRTPCEVADPNAERNATGWQHKCCGYSHSMTSAIGRPRTDDENAALRQKQMQAMAMLRQLG